eukprot:GABW01001498.1.p1 GENE.GABW01001498.1~~GABW01001498.1.p1  ORF type:complete len:113 (-),score=22.31 GABW01001498.1:3-341(-)
MDLVVWAKHSSAAVPFGTLVAIAALWFGISCPLVLVGAVIAYRKPPLEAPVHTNQIARQIPEQLWYMKPIPSMLLTGVLPFGAVFVELFCIYGSIWSNHYYYMFGLLFIHST